MTVDSVESRLEVAFAVDGTLNVLPRGGETIGGGLQDCAWRVKQALTNGE